MADRFSTIVILVEDGVQRDLVRQYLRRLGVDLHNARILPLAAGRGAGEQRVRLEFPKEVRAHRRASARGRSLMIAMIDADQRSVAERHQDLQRSLSDDGQGERTGDARIVVLVPKRHVETWIHHLVVGDANELADYTSSVPTADQKKIAADALFHGTRTTDAPPKWLASLKAAHPELRKIES